MNTSKIRDPRCWAKWQASGAVSRIVATSTTVYERTAPWHEIVHSVIDEAVGNWTQKHFQTPDRQVKAVLLKYANAVAAKILGSNTPMIDFSSNWGSRLSDEVYRMLDYEAFENEQIPLIASELQKRFGDITDRLKNGLWGYSLAKIANVVGMAVYMEKIGFSPDMLRMTPEEANEALLKMAKQLSKQHPGKVLVVDPSTDSVEDVVNEVIMRAKSPTISDHVIH